MDVLSLVKTDCALEGNFKIVYDDVSRTGKE